MTDAVLELDPATTTVALRTYAKGLLSPLAHDLEIVARELRGRAEAGAPWRARLELPCAGLRVAGVVRHGRVHAGVLSDADRQEIERRLRHEVLRGAATVVVEAEARGERATITVTLPSGRAQVACAVTIERLPGGAVTAQGRCELSLRALGVGEVRGPLGVFRIADGVEVSFRASFRPVAPGA